MIKLQVIGNLGKDAIVNNVNGKNVINFSVAHTEKFKDAQGAQREKTLWIEAAYWSDRTGIAPYLKKGTQVYVEGQCDVRQFTTKDGSHGASLSLRVSQIQLLGSSQNSVNGGYSGVNQQTERSYGGGNSSQSYNNVTEPMDDTDLPF